MVFLTLPSPTTQINQLLRPPELPRPKVRKLLPFLTGQNLRREEEQAIENCLVCGEPFTGKYRKRNRKRHMDRFHSGNNNGQDAHKRMCRWCEKLFSRSDGARKHERKCKSHENPNEMQTLGLRTDHVLPKRRK